MHFTDIYKLSTAIAKGLSLQNRRMSPDESMDAAEHLINFFGYNDRVIDNMLEPEDRDAFYTMEDIGVLQTEREETTLYDGREWRIHYWILNTERILELVNFKVVDQVLEEKSKIPVSIDTRHHETVSSLLHYGISMVNDITGLRSAEMRKVVLDNDLDAVIMHMKGEPFNMQTMTFYEDIIAELNKFFFEQIRKSWEDGINLERIIIDPGIGFAKGLKGNMDILRNIDSFKIGQRLLVGTSRKTFIGKITGSSVEERLPGTIATSIYLSGKGVDILRLHDVRENRDAIKMMRLLEGSDSLP